MGQPNLQKNILRETVKYLNVLIFLVFLKLHPTYGAKKLAENIIRAI